tara:strand:- start:2362 stop:2649 length:288 start_codon:yes stop_codon:yes gene_type:complete
MSAYWITRCHVTDSDVYNKYLDLAGPAIKKFGGKFLARGGKQFEKEGQGFERTVLVEFSSLDRARQCYESHEYAEALSYSNCSSNRLVVLVEGLE